MINLAIIPARSGSKGLKDKNIKKINNKTLIEIAYEIAEKSGIFSHIIVSTDSLKYKEILEKKKIFIHSLRSKKFAKDNTSDLELLTYEIKKFEKTIKKKVNYVALLQPTSPVRDKWNLIKCYELIKNKKLDAVWTISKINRKFNPIKILKTKNNKLIYFSPKGPQFNSRQKLDDYYIRNGLAYFFSRNSIIKYKKILPKKSSYFEIKKEISNIDNLDDFKKAKKLLKGKI
tara:strand:+ start:9 stop:701 length:693 start_codon:yes stop_codon:yes gene_type:complete